jgi:hypothetical protein
MMSAQSFIGQLRDSLSPRRLHFSSNAFPSLCRNCSAIVIDQNTLGKDVPESKLRSGSVALDLGQGYFNLSYRTRDSYPQMPGLRKSAGSGCSFCTLLVEAIDEDRTVQPQCWDEKFNNGDSIIIKLRYSCEPELGMQTFDDDQWPTMLSSLQACVFSSSSSSSDPILLIFKLYGDFGMSSCLKQSEISKKLRPTRLSRR